MLGGVSYGQTQYAHTGLREASKLRFFQEFVTLADSKFLAMKKSFIDSVLVYDLIERLLYHFKTFMESIKLGFNSNIEMFKSFFENITILESFTKSFKIVYKEFLLVIDSLTQTTLLLLKEFLKISFGVIHLVKKGFIEMVSFFETFKTYLAGMFLAEHLIVTENVTKKFSVLFKSFIGVLDIIRTRLNGFLLRWTKKSLIDTTWTKTESPETTWTKKPIRRVED